MRILLVEDSEVLRESLASWLSARGWGVDEASGGRAAREYLASYPYEVVLLDLGLPDIDGLQLLRELRDQGGTSRVMVLSARDQIGDRIEALNLGADDYLVKPFSFEELASRLLALMRRSLASQPPVLSHEGIEVDPSTRIARVAGQPLPLTPKEFLLLEALMRHRGKVLSRDQLFEMLYDSRSASSDKVIEVLVSTLRAKLTQAGCREVVQTRRGFGYVVE